MIEMKRRALLGAGMAAPPLGGCGGDLSRTIDYRTRFKVVVEVDGQEHEGVSVFRTRWRDRRGEFNLMGGRFSITVWAEATVVDLGPEHGLVFALLRQPEHDFLFPAYVFPRFAVGYFERPKAGDERPAALRELAALRGEFNVPQDEWPIFVRFLDPNTPSTVEEVTPRNFSTLYGEGAAIKRLTMEITAEEPTRRIESVLPWLEGLETNLAGDRQFFAEGAIAGRLGAVNFLLWNATF